MIKDKRIVKYDTTFCFRGYKFDQGAIRIDLSDVKDMHGHVIAGWTVKYAQDHLHKLLGEATGIKGGWTFEYVTVEQNKFNNDINVYDFVISSRIYKNLRRIYEKRIDV